MTSVVDRLSASVSRAVETLFVQHPRATSLGTFIGVAVDGLLKMMAPRRAGFTLVVEPSRSQPHPQLAILQCAHLFAPARCLSSGNGLQ